MVLQGPRDIGKLDTIRKAVWYAKEHEDTFCVIQHGAYLIDLKNIQKVTDIYEALISRLELTGKHSTCDDIVKSSALYLRKCLIVFEGL